MVHSPKTPRSTAIIKLYLTLITILHLKTWVQLFANTFPRMKEIFDPSNTRIMTGFRRHKNLNELLNPASFPNTHKKQQPPPNAGCHKRKKCFGVKISVRKPHWCQIQSMYYLVKRSIVLFALNAESPSITSAATGASFKVKHVLSCKEIYCAICIECNLQDVGSTKLLFTRDKATIKVT